MGAPTRLFSARDRILDIIILLGASRLFHNTNGMGFLNLFQLKLFDPDQFEKELSSIAQDISRTRNKITILGRRRHTASRSFISYTIIIYAAWIMYRYNVALRNLGILSKGQSRLNCFLNGQLSGDLVKIFVLPIVIAAVNFLINSFYRYLISGQRKRLDSMVKKHKAKIEELKKLSNYNTTNLLLEKYGDKPPRKALGKPGNSPKTNKRPRKPMQKKKPSNGLPPTANIPKANPLTVTPPPSLRPPPSPAAPVSKSFQDRILDYIIGSDHNENIESRYALICANCYTHNGLAPPGSTDPFSTTYICRNCGFINGQLLEGSPLFGQASRTDDAPEVKKQKIESSTLPTEQKPDEEPKEQISEGILRANLRELMSGANNIESFLN